MSEEPIKVYESARCDMYAAMEESNPENSIKLFEKAAQQFSRFLQDCSKSHGVYADLVNTNQIIVLYSCSIHVTSQDEHYRN